ncbi:MAG: hypothetical protein P4M11_11100 [Candidatus Pacebacteria bacterium]|nr:hypothetical protein [Candidatus Paceibacterota bacterium]
MARLLPKLGEIREKQAMRTKLFLPSVMESHEEQDVLPRLDRVLGKVPKRKSTTVEVSGISVDVVCEWEFVRSKAMDVSGFRYIITRVEEEAHAPDLGRPVNNLKVQFAYSAERNCFFQQPESAAPVKVDERLARECTRIGVTDVGEKITESELDAKKRELPKFYAHILPQVERVCKYFEDNTMLDSVCQLIEQD